MNKLLQNITSCAFRGHSTSPPSKSHPTYHSLITSNSTRYGLSRPSIPQARPFSSESPEITSNEHGMIIHPKKGLKHDGTLIWLHGLGDSADGFYTLFKEFFHPNFPSFKVVLPNAPINPVTINRGAKMRSWYDVISLNREGNVDIEGFEKSRAMVNKIIDREADEVGSIRVALGGFSQGGAMAAYTGLQYSKTIAGVICCSGYIIPPLIYENKISPANARTKVLCLHGAMDPVVPYPWADSTYNALKSSGVDVTIEMDIYQAHDVTPYQLDRISLFVSSQISSENTEWSVMTKMDPFGRVKNREE